MESVLASLSRLGITGDLLGVLCATIGLLTVALIAARRQQIQLDRAWDFATRMWMIVLVFAVGAKLLRTWPLVGNSPLSVLDVIRPEVCLYIGLLVLTRVSVSLSDRERVKMLLALAWVPIFVLCSFSELVGQFMFMSTGNHLDAPVLGYALLHFVAVWVVLQSELSLSSGILLFLPPALLIWIYQARPWLELNVERRGSRWVGAVVSGGIAIILAYPLPGSMIGDAAGRPVPLELVRTALRGSELPKVSVDTLEGWSDAVLLPSTRPSVAKNVAVISLESVGYNATSLAGMYDVTPNLLALSKHSLVAHQAWVVVSHSTKANVAIFCGIDPYLGQTVLEATHLPAMCLPRLLNEQGYASLMLSSATRKFENLTGLIQNTGFQQYLAYEDLDTTGFEAVNYFGVEDDVMIEPAREWLTQQGDTPFFISYMTGAPHHDYQVPSRFEMQRIVEDDTHNRYLNLVRYVDRFIGKVIELHKELGLYDNTIFVIVGDHGEAFGEHGYNMHDAVPYQEVLHVPLLVHIPGAFEGGKQVHYPSSQLDIMPTIAHALGYDVVAPAREGIPLQSEGTPRLMKASCWYERRCASIRDENFVYVYHFGSRNPELFDVSQDPKQTKNIIQDHPERAERMKTDLLHWSALGRARYEQSQLE